MNQMITGRVALIAAVVSLAPLGGPVRAQQPSADLRIDAATRQAVIDKLAETLESDYVYPDVARKMTTAIRERQKRGAYDSVTLGPIFAQLLTFHLREVSRDGHIRVHFSADPIPERNGPREPTADEIAQYRLSARRSNFGFERLERLEGNVGYLDLRGFAQATEAAETARDAMSFLSNADVLIVDLRQNGGGDPAMVALLTSYLYEGEPIHLNSLYWRARDRTEDFWTLKDVPGKRFANKPVYVLTSERTFSAAEEFSYNLKNLKRATLVGETTGGGANPGGFQRLAEHFGMFVPTGRAINPITKTNWEGTGVEPDVRVPAGYALEWAHHDALVKLAAAEKEPRRARALEAAVADAAKALEAAKAKIPAEQKPSVVGNTTFRLEGVGHARRVALAGSFNNWDRGATLCAREGDAWVCRVDLPPGRHAYRFVVDGLLFLDPENASVEEDGRGGLNSVFVK